jgi:hypothetical protein
MHNPSPQGYSSGLQGFGVVVGWLVVMVVGTVVGVVVDGTGVVVGLTHLY